MIKIFGLINCDTCRNSLKWIENNSLDYEFCDIRKKDNVLESIDRWAHTVGWENLLNRRSKTWRSLPEHEIKEIDEANAIRLMLENPTLIKRPVFDLGDRVFVGFNAKQKAILKSVS